MAKILELFFLFIGKVILMSNIPEKAMPFLANLSENEIMLSAAEISQYNAKMQSKTTKLYDLSKEDYSQTEIKNLINSYHLPALPKYNQNKLITKSQVDSILANTNVLNIPAKVKGQKALIKKRTNLRSFPTSITFSDTKSGQFDRLQESSLSVNTPVLILHASHDQKYFFVLASDYYGWVLAADVIKVSPETFTFFSEPQEFVVITAREIKVNATILDMGVKLPLEKITHQGYEVKLPDGDTTILKFKDATKGYLPYTPQNVIIQALKYENTPYSWGSKNYGVDCSDFIQNVYQTFGFTLPRNTADQSKVGEIITLENKTLAEKRQIIRQNYPSLLYQDGHVLLYLGNINNTDYVIDAAGNPNLFKVTVEKLDATNYLKAINKQILIK